MVDAKSKSLLPLLPLSLFPFFQTLDKGVEFVIIIITPRLSYGDYSKTLKSVVFYTYPVELEADLISVSGMTSTMFVFISPVLLLFARGVLSRVGKHMDAVGSSAPSPLCYWWYYKMASDFTPETDTLLTVNRPGDVRERIMTVVSYPKQGLNIRVQQWTVYCIKGFWISKTQVVIIYAQLLNIYMNEGVVPHPTGLHVVFYSIACYVDAVRLACITDWWSDSRFMSSKWSCQSNCSISTNLIERAQEWASFVYLLLDSWSLYEIFQCYMLTYQRAQMCASCVNINIDINLNINFCPYFYFYSHFYIMHMLIYRRAQKCASYTSSYINTNFNTNFCPYRYYYSHAMYLCSCFLLYTKTAARLSPGTVTVNPILYEP